MAAPVTLSISFNVPQVDKRIERVLRNQLKVIEDEIALAERWLERPLKYWSSESMPKWKKERALFWFRKDSISITLKSTSTPYVWVMLGQGRGPGSASDAGRATLVGYQSKTQVGSLTGYPGAGEAYGGIGPRIRTEARMHHELVAKKREKIFGNKVVTALKKGLITPSKTKYTRVTYKATVLVV